MGHITPIPRAKVTASPSATTLLWTAMAIAIVSGLVGFFAGRVSRSSAPQPVSSAFTAPDAGRPSAVDPPVERPAAELSVAPLAAATTPVIPSEPMPKLELAGNSQQATQLVTLPEGLCRIELRHSGSSNFAVWLLDDNGKRIELLVNKVGAFAGAKSVRIPQSGRYLFDVSADGAWSISTSAPDVADNISSFTGTDQTSTVQFPLAAGLHVFRLAHQGDSNFVVWLLDDRGKKVELLVNTTGVFSGSKAVRVRTGNYSFDVSANGPWTIERQAPE